MSKIIDDALGNIDPKAIERVDEVTDKIDGSILLAEFDDRVLRVVKENRVFFNDYHDFGYLGTTDELSLENITIQYTKSLDWLLPIIEKVESFGFSVTIDKWTTVYRKKGDGYAVEDIATFYEEDKVTNTFKALVKFVEWYNENGE